MYKWIVLITTSSILSKNDFILLVRSNFLFGLDYPWYCLNDRKNVFQMFDFHSDSQIWLVYHFWIELVIVLRHSFQIYSWVYSWFCAFQCPTFLLMVLSLWNWFHLWEFQEYFRYNLMLGINPCSFPFDFSLWHSILTETLLYWGLCMAHLRYATWKLLNDSLQTCWILPFDTHHTPPQHSWIYWKNPTPSVFMSLTHRDYAQ